MRWRDLVEEVGGGSGEKWREEAGQGQLCCCWSLLETKEMKKNERERRWECYIYEEENNIICAIFTFLPKNAAFSKLRLGKKEPNAGFKAASREKRKEAAFQRKRTKHGGFDLS